MENIDKKYYDSSIDLSIEMFKDSITDQKVNILVRTSTNICNFSGKFLADVN